MKRRDAERRRSLAQQRQLRRRLRDEGRAAARERENRIEDVLRASRGRDRGPDRILELIERPGEHAGRAGRLLKEAALNPRRRRTLARLVRAVAKSKLLDADQPVMPHLGRGLANTMLGAVIELSRRQWLRPPEDWSCRTHNRLRQLSSLARHLLADYDVPRFMDEAWLTRNRTHQNWFACIGQGLTLRHDPSLPIPMTRAMLHRFLGAPSDLPISNAIRYGQVLGLGGNERSARSIVATRLGTSFEADDFWTTVIRFFVDHPMLDPAQFGPIVDYLHHERFVSPGMVREGAVTRRLPPAQPNLSMRGRSPTTLLRQVEDWHGRLGRLVESDVEWPASGVRGYEAVEGDPARRRYIVRELRSGAELVREGRELRHCVATYAHSCRTGRCAIFSLMCHEEDRVRPMITAEVDLRTQRVAQARGRLNRPPDPVEQRLIRAWAAGAELEVASWI